jgi:hypothetical protein
MFYNELGGVANQNITTTHNANYNFFNNVLTGSYWSSTEIPVGDGSSNPYTYVWGMNFTTGSQGGASKDSQLYAWLITPENIATVPLPNSIWTFVSGLSLLFFKRQVYGCFQQPEFHLELAIKSTFNSEISQFLT